MVGSAVTTTPVAPSVMQTRRRKRWGKKWGKKSQSDKGLRTLIRNPLIFLVGARGFEPPPPAPMQGTNLALKGFAGLVPFEIIRREIAPGGIQLGYVYIYVYTSQIILFFLFKIK